MTNQETNTGPAPNAIVPPKMNRAMENPNRRPAYAGTMPAAGGWNMDCPTEPRAAKTRRGAKLEAQPKRGMKTAVSTGPPKTKALVWYRSARYPTEGWTMKAASMLVPVTSPTWVMDRDSFSVKAGRSGLTKAMKKSPIKWTRKRAKMTLVFISPEVTRATGTVSTTDWAMGDSPKKLKKMLNK